MARARRELNLGSAALQQTVGVAGLLCKVNCAQKDCYSVLLPSSSFTAEVMSSSLASGMLLGQGCSVLSLIQDRSMVPSSSKSLFLIH